MSAVLLYQSTFPEVALRNINSLPCLNVVELHVSPLVLISSSNSLEISIVQLLAFQPAANFTRGGQARVETDVATELTAD